MKQSITRETLFKEMISIKNKPRKMDNVYHIQLPRDTHLQNVKEHYQKNKEEMQKKGRIKMAKRKNKDIDTLQKIFVTLEDKLTKEDVDFLKSCIRKSFMTKKDIEE